MVDKKRSGTKRRESGGTVAWSGSLFFGRKNFSSPSPSAGRREANNYWAAGSDTRVMYQPVVIKSCFVVS